MSEMVADWRSGIRDRDNQTPETLRKSAESALLRAREWIETAERLIGKAEDLERSPK